MRDKRTEKCLVPTPYLNRERTTEILARANLQGLVLSAPTNVHYATNKTLLTETFSFNPTTVAIIPANPDLPVALICHGFEVYFGGFNHGIPEDVQLYLIGGLPFVDALGWHEMSAPPIIGTVELEYKAQRMRALLTESGPYFKDADAAGMRALADLGLKKGMLGVDGDHARLAVERMAPGVRTRDSGDLMLHIRAVKTPLEIALIRKASMGTVVAVEASTQSISSSSGTLQQLRRNIFAGMAVHGVTPALGVVDGVYDDFFEEDLDEGRSVMIDIVGHCEYYQSDYGRTIFFGEPAAPIRRAVEAISSSWDELRATLRAGISFSQIHEIGAEILKKIDPRLISAFNPHLVGLQHWDQPRFDLEGNPYDVMLREGMVVSVDCPLLVEGLGGSGHIEDLCVVTSDGLEPLHSTANPIIVV